MIVPTCIKKIDDQSIAISWQDNPSTLTLTGEFLRKNCPCASCRQPQKPSPKLSLRVVEKDKDSMCRIARLWAIGNYAIGIEFADGHKTGIFSFSLLRQWSTP